MEPERQYHVDISQVRFPILNHINPLHVPPLCFTDLCNMIIPATLISSKRAVVFNFPHQNPLCFFSHKHVTTVSPTVSTLVLSPECYLLRGTNLKFHRTVFSSFLFLPLFFHFLSTLFSDTSSLGTSHRERRSFIFFLLLSLNKL
jgi:hypothetical protein